MELQGGYFGDILGYFGAILGLFWAPGSPSNHLILQPAQGARARRLLHKKEVHDQARGALDMAHMQVQRETISMEEPTTKKRNDHTKERREGNEHKRKSQTWSCLGPS